MGSALRNRVKDVIPSIRKNAQLTESQGRVADENVTLLQEAGFFRALQPKSFGGSETAIPEYAECIIDIAEACASTAWACGLLANHSHAIALYSDKLQKEIWADNPQALISSSVAPMGKWQPAEGGIRLSGRFGWSSGSDHAQWAVLGYMGNNEIGQPGPCFAVVPRQDYTILDDWDSAALKGSGSKSIVLDDVFVPDYRSESLFALNYGLSRGFKSHPGDIYYLPFSPVFSLGFAAVAVGIARRMAEVFKEKTAIRVRAYTGAKVAESAPAYMRLAESVNQTTAAHELLRRDWREMSGRCAKLALPSPEDVLNWRVHQSYATKMAIEAVDRLFSAAGGSAWFNTNEMQKLFRDVHICGSHAQTDYDIAAQTYGRHLLGLPADAKNY